MASIVVARALTPGKFSLYNSQKVSVLEVNFFSCSPQLKTPNTEENFIESSQLQPHVANNLSQL